MSHTGPGSRATLRIARCCAVLVLIVAACGPPGPDELAKSVVRVEALPCGRTGIGTGSVVGDELVLTNAHLVAGSAGDVTIRTWEDRLLPGIVVGFDPERDLALIHVDDLDLGPVGIGDPVEGSAASILARPSGVTLEKLEALVVRGFNATGDDIYGEGDVSRKALELDVDVIPGMSGAGVYDDEGDLIGVVFAESHRRRGVSYAVASSEVRAFLAQTDTTGPADTLRCRDS